MEGRCVGGSTEINSALWMRTQEPAIERWRERFGVRELSFETHEALTDRIETKLEIASLNSPSPPPSSRPNPPARKLSSSIINAI